MDKITVAVLVGTARELRLSIFAAKYIAEYGKKLPNTEVILVDPQEFNFPLDGNDLEYKDPRYTEITRRADAFFIIIPEYNHSFSGSLKRMLDSEFDTYNHKPVALAGVSNGGWGGTRAVESMVPVVRELGMVAISFDVYFPRIQEIFDNSGKIRPDLKKHYDQSIGSLYSELIWFAKILKANRSSN